MLVFSLYFRSLKLLSKGFNEYSNQNVEGLIARAVNWVRLNFSIKLEPGLQSWTRRSRDDILLSMTHDKLMF